MEGHTIIELDSALACTVEAMSALSEEEPQRKLEALRRLDADVERVETMKTRVEASASRARRRYKDVCSARDAASLTP